MVLPDRKEMALRRILSFLLVALHVSALAAESSDLHTLPRKKALIFGITGQDGAYLTEFLLNKNYEVHGVKRPSSTHNTSRIDAFYQDPHESGRRLILHYGDISSSSDIVTQLATIQPDEIYNLAAQSHVLVSFKMPEYTAEVDAVGTLRILEAIRKAGLEKKTRFYQASSSEMYGMVKEIPQTENTPFHPRSPYAVAKLYSFWITTNYREAYGMFTVNGILFNHESPLRGETFVTRKITLAACRYKCGLQDVLYLGNLDSKRDWGYAKDYVEAMWLMLQQETPEDFVIATGETHSIREFVELAYKELGIEIEWRGQGIDEVGIDRATGNTIIRIDPRYFRPAEVDFLLGNAAKAKAKLHWKPKTSFKELVKIMISADLEIAEREKQTNREK